MSEHVLVDRPAEGVALVTIDRAAKRNALSVAVRDGISDALDALAADESVKCLVITGAGEVFSAGFDLSEFSVTEPGFQERLWASSDRYHHRVLTFPVPTIAAVNGPAYAGGFDLATMCDLRVVADTARFARPERAWSDICYLMLHDLLGGAMARELTLTGRTLDAAEALAVGLATRVVPRDALVGEAVALAVEVAAPPRPALVRTKAKVLARMGVDPAAATLAL